MRKILLFILISQFFLITTLRAEGGLQIAPGNNDIILKPGEAYTASFKIKNNNEFDVNLEVQKGEIDSSNKVILSDFPDSSTEWIRLNLDKVEIKSLHESDFNYSISVPSDAQEGVYRPLFIFKLSSSNDEAGSITALTQLLPFQFNIFASESGVYNGELAFKNLTVENKFLIGSTQKISYILENKNTSPAKPLIRVQIVSQDNKIIYQVVDNDKLAYLLNSKPLENTLTTDSFTQEMDLGRYSVEIYAKDLLTDRSVTQKLYFWYIPQKAILIIVSIVSLIILLVIIRLWLKRNSGIKKKDKHLFMYK